MVFALLTQLLFGIADNATSARCDCATRASCGYVARSPRTLPGAFISLVNDIVNTRDFYDVVFLANTCSSQIMLEEKGDVLLILDLGSLSERFRCGLLFSFSCNGNGRGFVFAC